MNDLLVPYALVEGVWSLPDEFLLSVAVQMQREGTFQRVFYDGTIKDPYEFMELMQRNGTYPVFSFCGEDPTTVAWLNGVSGAYAFAHFCTLSGAKGRTVEIGRKVVDYWLMNFDFLRAILGLTPANNKLAVRYVERLGFDVLGTIPGILYDAYAGEWVGGTISYRKSHYGR